MADAPETFAHPINQALRERAMGFPGTTEGASCVNRAFKAGGKKNFLFLGEKADRCTLMLKVSDVAGFEAASAGWGGEWSVGKGGWVSGKYPAAEAPSAEALAPWVAQSWRLFATKTLQKQHDAG